MGNRCCLKTSVFKYIIFVSFYGTGEIEKSMQFSENELLLKNDQWIFINIINQCIQENNRAVQEKQKRTMDTNRPSLKSNLLR